MLEIDFSLHHWTQRVWNHGKPLGLLSISKVGVFWTTLVSYATCPQQHGSKSLAVFSKTVQDIEERKVIKNLGWIWVRLDTSNGFFIKVLFLDIGTKGHWRGAIWHNIHGPKNNDVREMHHSRLRNMEPEVSGKCCRYALHCFNGLWFTSGEKSEEIYGRGP